MEDLIKELYRMVVELKKISETNNELLGFVCRKIAPAKQTKDELDFTDMMYISMEMSEICEKYNVMPDEYGLA